MVHAVVVGNAPWRWSPPFVTLVRQASLLIAADGGANHLARVGLRPHAVVGDLDSIRPGVRRWVGEERVVSRPDQDFTDLHKTLAYAIDERGAQRLTLLAVTGGRVDHALENLALLARWSTRADLEAWDGETRIVPVRQGARLGTRPGQTISLVPVGRCAGIRTRGLRWPLSGEALDLLERTSVSNLATGDEVEIALADGCLLVCCHDSSPAGDPTGSLDTPAVHLPRSL